MSRVTEALYDSDQRINNNELTDKQILRIPREYNIDKIPDITPKEIKTLNKLKITLSPNF